MSINKSLLMWAAVGASLLRCSAAVAHSMRPHRILVIAGLAVLALSATPAAAVFNVGRLAHPLGSAKEQDIDQDVAGLISAASTDLVIEERTTDFLDGNFFDSIDAFAYQSCAGTTTINLGSTQRANLQNFVLNGGVAYLAIDAVQDGQAIAASFGFSLSNQLPLQTVGTIVGSNPIASGPFQPATTFGLSSHGRFTGSPPANGAFIGTSDNGWVAAYRQYGQGKVYIFADEGPINNWWAHDHIEIFENVLYDAGAPLVPEPATVGLLVVGAAALLRRRRS